MAQIIIEIELPLLKAVRCLILSLHCARQPTQNDTFVDLVAIEWGTENADCRPARRPLRRATPRERPGRVGERLIPSSPAPGARPVRRPSPAPPAHRPARIPARPPPRSPFLKRLWRLREAR